MTLSKKTKGALSAAFLCFLLFSGLDFISWLLNWWHRPDEIGRLGLTLILPFLAFRWGYESSQEKNS